MKEEDENVLSILPVAVSICGTSRAAVALAIASRSARVKYVVVFCGNSGSRHQRSMLGGISKGTHPSRRCGGALRERNRGKQKR